MLLAEEDETREPVSLSPVEKCELTARKWPPASEEAGSDQIDTESEGTFILAFPDPTTVRNKCLLFKPPVDGVLL